jgi:predicted TIM-barrel fold metal-dependent hydrolase
MIEPLARRVHELGWHIQVNMPAAQLPANEALLLRVPTPIVFDHLARIPVEASPQRAAVLSVVKRVVDSGRGWVKLTAPYLASKAGPPGYEDAGAIVKDLVGMGTERLLWGTDWPHPTHQQHLPDDALLADRFADWVPDESHRRRILVDNPHALYRF